MVLVQMIFVCFYEIIFDSMSQNLEHSCKYIPYILPYKRKEKKTQHEARNYSKPLFERICLNRKSEDISYGSLDQKLQDSHLIFNQSKIR